MRKTRKLFCMVFTVILVFSLLCAVSFANTDTTAQTVENADNLIQNTIDNSVTLANYAVSQQSTILNNFGDSAASAEQIKTVIDNRIDNIVSKLVDKTNEIASRIVDLAEKHGITLVSEYVPVVINGKTYYIDPLCWY